MVSCAIWKNSPFGLVQFWSSLKNSLVPNCTRNHTIRYTYKLIIGWNPKNKSRTESSFRLQPNL
jgi:hypothetical protein